MVIKSVNKKSWVFLFPVLSCFFIFSTCGHALDISFNDPKLQYMGRIGYQQDASVLYWPGSSVRIDFEGTDLIAELKDEKEQNYYYVIVDSTNFTKLKPDKSRKKYTLATGLPPGRHSVQLYKLTDISKGKTFFYGFELGKVGHILSPPSMPKRKIEFFGNSITSGYSLEDTTGDSGDSKFYNNYLAYSAITARHYNADFHCISRSGIGIMVSWSPEIMPEIYDKLDPYDSTLKWDFSKFTPEVVVINLMQNDYWLVGKPKYEQFIRRFGATPPNETQIINAYKNFIQLIRGKYPDASIICTLGSMDATAGGCPFPEYIEKAVSLLNDSKIYTHFFPFRQSPGHPKKKEQQENAEDLIRFIDTHHLF